MQLLTAVFDIGLALETLVLMIVSGYILADRVTHGIRVYVKVRGNTLVTCPESQKAAMVQVAAKSAGMQAILGEPRLRLSDCSRWPMRGGCGQECLNQIEARPSRLRFSAACRVS
jgi:hypothetical protein